MTGYPSLHLWLIPLLPFLGFVLNGWLGRRLPKALVSTIALLFTAAPLALVSSIALRFSSLPQPYIERLSAPWMDTSAFRADFAFMLDPLTLIMLLVVTGVGFLIHIYSVGYMAHEEGYWRYFAYLNLFMFFMLTLVLAENFLLMFVGWEGVGLASYLLIGFYYERPSAADAGKKAFILNRVGDFGFLLAMFLMIAHFGSLSYERVFSAITQHPQLQGGFLTAIALLLVLGATGKSAQIPLYVWLPDAMEGPTPVSALIHAATMVTAGVYMIVRSHVLFDRSPFALGVVAIIGAATALFAATVGMVQTDIKRVLAYSTISQLGYMFLACGAGRLRRRHLPPGHPRLLQRPALPRRRLRHPCPGRRAGYARHGRPAQGYPHHLLDHECRRFRHLRPAALLRLLQQRRDPLPELYLAHRRADPLVCRHRHCPAHRLLHVPPLVSHLLR